MQSFFNFMPYTQGNRCTLMMIIIIIYTISSSSSHDSGGSIWQVSCRSFHSSAGLRFAFHMWWSSRKSNCSMSFVHVFTEWIKTMNGSISPSNLHICTPSQNFPIHDCATGGRGRGLSISQTARFLFPFLLKIESIGCTGHFVLQAWRTCCMQTAGRTSLSLSTLCKNVEFSRCVKNLQESCAMLSFKPPSLPLTFSLFDKCMNFVI